MPFLAHLAAELQRDKAAFMTTLTPAQRVLYDRIQLRQAQIIATNDPQVPFMAAAATVVPPFMAAAATTVMPPQAAPFLAPTAASFVPAHASAVPPPPAAAATPAAQQNNNSNANNNNNSNKTALSSSPKRKKARTITSGNRPAGIETDHDVLLGRGGGTNHNPGNIQFRKIVASHQAAYVVAKKSVKRDIAEQCVKKVHDSGGRFWKKNAADDGWEPATPQEALSKASQALREGQFVREKKKRIQAMLAE